MATAILPQLDLYQKVLHSDLKDEDGILSLPNRRRPRDQRQLAQDIASAAYPDLSPMQAVIQYDAVIRKAKAAIREAQHARQQADLQARIFRGPWLGQELEPISLDGPLALPMPVTIPPRETFKPIFDFLKKDKDPQEYIDGNQVDPNIKVGREMVWNSPQVEFERGIVYDDGRLDLCKMVLGPTHITELMDSLEENTHVNQFLLGNNIISSTGAYRIAEFIRENPNHMETWYIAGGHITANPFAKMADAMTLSDKITNVWLKRNPLGAESVPSLVHLITKTRNLRTLDLENTQLGDAGVEKLLTELRGKKVALRNLYLNANGMGVKASKALAAYLQDPSSELESLFLGSNPIGSAGISFLAPALATHKSLKRLGLQSTGLDSQGVAMLCEALTGHATLQALDLGAAITTLQHRQRFNHFDDTCLAPLIRFLTSTPKLRWCSLGRTAFTTPFFQTLHSSITNTPLVFFSATLKGATTCSLALRQTLESNMQNHFPGFKGSYEDFLRSLECRFLINTEDVRLIDSHYRTRDKREKGILVQEWEEGDETWALVQADAAMYD